MVAASENTRRNEKLTEHIKQGCCNNLSVDTTESFEFLLTNKLQSLWTLKQTIKGEGGLGYILNVSLPKENGVEEPEEFRVRTSNCFLHGAFKGFLIEVEHVNEDGSDYDDSKLSDVEKKNLLITRFTTSINKIKQLLETYNFPDGSLCFNVLSETKLDYLSDLCQQYCDALQF